jgi:hypothetical protein
MQESPAGPSSSPSSFSESLLILVVQIFGLLLARDALREEIIGLRLMQVFGAAMGRSRTRSKSA